MIDGYFRRNNHMPWMETNVYEERMKFIITRLLNLIGN